MSSITPLVNKNLLTNRKVQVLFYALIIGLATPLSLPWPAKLVFWAFAFYLFWLLSQKCPPEKKRPLAAGGWLTILLLVIAATRLLPLIRWYKVIPLGTDAVVYQDWFSRCAANACPLTPENIPAKLLLAAGWPISWILYLFYLLLTLLVALTIYLLAKHCFGKGAALASVFLYAVSIPQFLAYLAFYWKMMGAMALALTALYLLERRSPLAIPVAGFAGAWHLPSLLPLGLAVGGRFIFGKNRLFALAAGLGIIILAAGLAHSYFFNYSTYYTSSFGLINHYPRALANSLKGQYIGIGPYQTLSLFYWPLIAIGFIWLLKERRSSYLLFYFIGAAALVLLKLVYYQRFLILLDLAGIVIAGAAAFQLFKRLWIKNCLLNKTIFALLIALAGGLIGYQSWFAQPFVTNPVELTEIKLLSKITKPRATIVAYNYLYSTLLEKLSRRKIVSASTAEKQLLDFSSPQKAAASYRLLNRIPPPVYLFIGQQTEQPPNLTDNLRFQRITTNLWQYNPSTSDIDRNYRRPTSIKLK